MCRFFFVLFFTFLIQDCLSQCNQGDVTTFQKVYGGLGNERTHSIQQTTDGGYIVAGETTSFGAGGKDIFVMKIDEFGSQQWTKTFGEGNDDDGFSITIKQTMDLGFIVSGSTNSFGAGSFDDSYVLRLSSVGAILWEKRISGNSWDRFRDVIELANGDFLLTGSAGTFSNGNMDVHLVKISATGNLIWINNIGTSVREHSQSVLELPGGNFITSGNTNITDTRNGFLIKTDNNGQTIWSKEYGVNFKQEDFNETILLNDGNLLSVGWSKPSDYDIWLMKSDTNGIVIWSKTYGGGGDDVGVNVREKSNGELVISSFSDSYGNGKELMLINTDNLGSLIWSKTYGGNNQDEIEWWGKSMDLSSNNEIIVAGGTYSYGAGNEDVYIVKTNECGYSFCNENDVVVTENSSILTGVDFNVLSVSGGNLLNTISIVGAINFTEESLCIDSTIVSEPCSLNANFLVNSTCIGDSLFITDLSIDNVGSITGWYWYFGDGDSIVGVQNPNHLYGSTGNFNVTLTVVNDSNCIDSITIPIVVNSVFNTAQNVNICQGDSILLQGIFQNTSGVYVDNLQTVIGCDSIVTTALTVYPVYESIQNQIICEGDSVFFSGDFYKVTGFYTDSLQTTEGCDSLFSFNLTVNPSYLISQNQEICHGDSVFFDGNFIDISGNYMVTVQTAEGCDSVTVLNLFVHLPVWTNDTVSICEGDNVFLEGEYQSQAGNYVATLNSYNGCDSIVNTTLLVEYSSNVIAFLDTTIDEGGSVQLSAFGAESYVWMPNYELNCNNCQHPIVSPQVTTTYIVQGGVGDCSSFDTITITVNDVSTFLLIPNSFTPNGDLINDEFVLFGEYIEEFKILVFNRWGELLFESNNIGNSWGGFYKGQEVPSGVYVYKVKVLSKNSENIEKYGHINLIR